MVQSKGGGVAGAFSREIKASVAPSVASVWSRVTSPCSLGSLIFQRGGDARLRGCRGREINWWFGRRRRRRGVGDGLKRRCKRNEDESRGRWARRGFQTRERGKGGGWGKAKEKKGRKGAFPSLRLPDGSKLFTRL